MSGGAGINDNDAASGGKCVQNLHLTGAGVQLNQIDGGETGGQATINIHYATADRAKLKLTVNAADYSFVNIFPTGGWDQFKGSSGLTVPLKPGKNNSIELTGGNGGVNVDYIEVSPL
ncbi:MAG TPA: carbohydrate-binding domain-containing protein [Verrucomicrobiae bacterium]|nr:carbohydrate-binding domain-containing protein [Verrucomicrobiae bacterium]